MADPASAPNQTDRTRQLAMLAVTAIVAFILAAGVRLTLEEDDVVAPGDRAWSVEIDISAVAVEGKTQISIAAPLPTRHLRTVGQNLSHPGWRQLFKLRSEPKSSRRINLIATESGRRRVQVTFTVQESATPHLLTTNPGARLDTAQREAFLQDHPLLMIDDPLVNGLIERLSLHSDSNLELTEAIFQRVSELSSSTGNAWRTVPETLADGRANLQERAYAMVALCRAARIPARLVRGFVLEEAPNAKPYFWVETYLDDQWVPYDPFFDYRESLPKSYLPFVKGPENLVDTDTAGDLAVDFSVMNTDLLFDAQASDDADWWAVFDLQRLPLETRLVLASLMLLPLGVLIAAFCSQIIGLRFYGVFTPVLLAMSLSFIPWPSALTVLATVLVLGVIGRSIVPDGLARVSRLSIVFTLVALSLVAGASLLQQFGNGFTDELVLLPIVVLVSLVDRFYTVLDDNGAPMAMARLGWTAVVALICIPLVQYEALGHLLLHYPESHLLTLAALFGLSTYRGKRLSQLPALSWIDLDTARKKQQDRDQAST